MSILKQIINLFKKRADQECFIGEGPFQGKQKLLERYDEKVEIGSHGCLYPDGTWKYLGKIYAQTVKYKGEDGKIKLGTDWVADFPKKEYKDGYDNGHHADWDLKGDWWKNEN